MIDNANITQIDDNGIRSLIIEPCEGYKLRRKDDNTYSTMYIAMPAEYADRLSEYIAVPVDEPDKAVEIPTETSEEDDELTAEEALAIITGGGADET